jgi:hypothetical protein
MSRHALSVPLQGPWSVVTSRRFGEGFAPAALPGADADDRLRTVFRVEADRTRAEATVGQDGETAHLSSAATVTSRPRGRRLPASCRWTSTPGTGCRSVAATR